MTEARIRRLIEALEFYADDENYEFGVPGRSVTDPSYPDAEVWQPDLDEAGQMGATAWRALHGEAPDNG